MKTKRIALRNTRARKRNYLDDDDDERLLECCLVDECVLVERMIILSMTMITLARYRVIVVFIATMNAAIEMLCRAGVADALWNGNNQTTYFIN